MKRLIVVGAVLLAVGFGGGIVQLWHHFSDKVGSFIPQFDSCTAEVHADNGDFAASLDPTQAANAALIVAVAVHRGLPAHAATVALATAMQESKLNNLSGGDRDSLGLFQQRPSQGWGTKKQIMDPVYASNKFYDALVKVPDYLDISVTKAAQAVQRSAYPEAYAAHEDAARALASSLSGASAHAFGCSIQAPDAGSGLPTDASDEIAGLFFVKPTVASDSSNSVKTLTVNNVQVDEGWAIAQFAVANAVEWGITSVSFNGFVWTADRDDQWHTSAPSSVVSIAFA